MSIDSGRLSPCLMAACITLLSGLLGNSILAQSATNFDTKTIAPKPEPAKTSKIEKPVTQAPKEVAPASGTPSRYVGEDDLNSYVESISGIFSMKNRQTDPFGQLQDPDAKPIIKPSVVKNSTRAAPVQITPFSDIIKLIEVKMIMPKEKKFLVGTRSISQGDTIPLGFRGKSIRVEVASVKSSEIQFRNLDNGETASLVINLLPVGMTPGTRGITAPGMVPEGQNSTLELESGNPSPENPQNP